MVRDGPAEYSDVPVPVLSPTRDRQRKVQVHTTTGTGAGRCCHGGPSAGRYCTVLCRPVLLCCQHGQHGQETPGPRCDDIYDSQHAETKWALSAVFRVAKGGWSSARRMAQQRCIESPEILPPSARLPGGYQDAAAVRSSGGCFKPSVVLMLAQAPTGTDLQTPLPRPPCAV